MDSRRVMLQLQIQQVKETEMNNDFFTNLRRFFVLKSFSDVELRYFLNFAVFCVEWEF